MTDIVEEILKIHGSTVLEHHGVKGMRWGHRKEESTSTSTSNSDSTKVGVDPVVTTVAALLALKGAHALVDSGKLRQFSNRNTPLKTNKQLTRKNMSLDQLNKTVVKPINPGFGGIGTKMNCRRCTFAYEMRRRGYNVKATHSQLATGQTSSGLVKAINPKGSPISVKHKSLRRSFALGETKIGEHRNFSKMSSQQKSDEIFKALNKLPHGSRGELGITWKFGGAHSLAWENRKGKSVIFDTQSGETYSSSTKLNKELGEHLHEAYVTRLDNKDLNMEFLGRWVRNVD